MNTLTDPIPDFPRLPGILHDLAEAITHDLAYEHKALALLAYLGPLLSGRVRLASEPWLQPRFFATIVGPPGFGKSAVDAEIRGALQSVLKEYGVEVIDGVESGQALTELMAKHRRVVLAPDEIAELFAKGRQTTASNSSLLQELLKLYEQNRTSRRKISQKKSGPALAETVVTDAQLSVFGGATDRNFDEVWAATRGSKTGLQTRFCLTYSRQMQPALRTATDERVLEEVIQRLRSFIGPYFTPFEEDNGQQIMPAPTAFPFSAEAQEAICWWAEMKSADVLAKHSRVLDMAKRYALLTHVLTGGGDAISGELMERGLAFADYQIEVKDLLMPEDAATNVQAFENRILKALKNGPLTESRIQGFIQPERFDGGYEAYNRAWNSLLRARRVRSVGKTRKKTPIFADVRTLVAKN